MECSHGKSLEHSLGRREVEWKGRMEVFKKDVEDKVRVLWKCGVYILL